MDGILPWTCIIALEITPSASAVNLQLSETWQLFICSMWHNPLLEMLNFSFDEIGWPFLNQANFASSGDRTHLNVASSPSMTVMLCSSAINSTMRGTWDKKRRKLALN